jgi:hypothetical protein
MPAYVDSARNRIGSMIMSHMWADTEEELLAMCDAIEFRRVWIQRPGMKPGPKKKAVTWLHCDVSQMMRARAIEAGAIETDIYGPQEHVARLTLADLLSTEQAKATARARIETIRQYRERRAR